MLPKGVLPGSDGTGCKWPKQASNEMSGMRRKILIFGVYLKRVVSEKFSIFNLS